MSDKQVKCKTRVADHGEVFTAEREVNAPMVSLFLNLNRIQNCRVGFTHHVIKLA